VATREVPRGTTVQVLPPHGRSLIALRYVHGGDTWTLQAYQERWRNSGLLVLKNGEVALESYGMGNTASSRWCTFSITKSVTSTLVGAALHDGSLDSLDRRIGTLVPQLAASPYADSTLRHLLRMCSGIRWTEDAANPASDLGALSAMVVAGRVGGPMELMRTRPRDWASGTRFNYSTGESFVLGAAVMAATGMSLSAYLSSRIWSRIGMEANANWTLDGKDGVELGGASISATLRDCGRLGLLMLRDGVHEGRRILPAGWRDLAGRPQDALTAPGAVWGDYPLGYGYQWWPFPGSSAFEAQGLYGQHMYIDPAEDLVVVVWNAWLTPGNFQAEKETWSLFAGIVQALR
jgi:CubicO group peptidase (beta-lactamase class C family)